LEEEKEEEEEWEEWEEMLGTKIPVDVDVGGDLLMSDEEEDVLQELGELHELRAAEQLLRGQPLLAHIARGVPNNFQRFQPTINRYSEIEAPCIFG